MLVLVGPSAAGKTECAKLLISDYGLKKLVTCTTREMRPGEVEGRDYYFLSRREFEEKISEDYFVEWIEYNKNFYGTPFSEIGPNKVVILEATGVKHYKEILGDHIKICYLDCPWEILEERMIQRLDSKESIIRRLELDKVLFADMKDFADWSVPAYNLSVAEMTKKIFQLYKSFNE